MQPILGQIVLFAGDFVIKGWAACDGQLLRLADNPALFSILGTTYGGDGRSTFALPTLADLGKARYLIATQGAYPLRP